MHFCTGKVKYRIARRKRNERDNAIAGVINSIQQYWESLDINTILTMDSDHMLKELKAIAADYSSELIQITFTKDNVSLEAMSEPITVT